MYWLLCSWNLLWGCTCSSAILVHSLGARCGLHHVGNYMICRQSAPSFPCPIVLKLYSTVCMAPSQKFPTKINRTSPCRMELVGRNDSKISCWWTRRFKWRSIMAVDPCESARLNILPTLFSPVLSINWVLNVGEMWIQFKYWCILSPHEDVVDGQ